MFIFIYALAFVLLVAMWVTADVEFRTKFIMTLVYGATWALWAASPAAVVAAQALFAIIVGLMTFGPDFGR